MGKFPLVLICTANEICVIPSTETLGERETERDQTSDNRPPRLVDEIETHHYFIILFLIDLNHAGKQVGCWRLGVVHT
ncbi:hypothetical protein Nepgr_001129 [Nepenthes gracilis]|uniref:Uncharacterized protein n=1 Tax=Nepenthes gracilis TaxID=150966 RepID=A0AAD3P5I1_NEPGR|nr:hypothetical protein Nepgr_001129 [Nepenthes gracilis]